MLGLGLGVNLQRVVISLINRLLSILKGRSTYFENESATKSLLNALNTDGLLEKASILITPTAYSDGKINSAKPIDPLGSEQVVNGDYNQSGTGNAVSQSGGLFVNIGGSLKITSDGSSAFSRAVWDTYGTSGQTFIVKANIVSKTGSVRFINVSNNQGVAINVGSFSQTTTLGSGGGFLGFGGLADSGFEIILDNLSIKEVTDADLNFTRGSAGTRVNAQGLIENSQGNNIPRINYKDGVGSWLIEPQSTNLYLNSALIVTQNITTLASSYTVSFYGTGTITFTGTYSGSLTGTGVNDRVSITFTTTSGTLTSTVSGTVTQGQAEQGEKTSYIPTNGSVQTRLAETASRSGLGDLIDSTQGVFYAEISALYDNSEDDLRWISLNDNSTSNLVAIYYYKATNTIGVQLRVDNVQVFRNDNIPITSKTDFIKIAFKWKQDDVSIYVDGTQKASSTSVNSFNSGVLNRFSFDGGNQLPSFYGNAKVLAVFPILTDEELTCLTTT